jgi:hypothetical protein
MRFLTALVIVAAVGWGGYWFVGERALDHGVSRLLENTPEVQVASYEVHGFPNRFDVTLNEPRYESGRAGWSAPFFQVFALSYRLNHIIAVFPNEQIVTLDGVEWLVRSDDMRASVVAQATTNLGLDRTSFIADALRLRTDSGTFLAETTRLATRAIDDSSAQHDIALEVLAMHPDAALLASLDPTDSLPAVIDRLRVAAEVTFDRPIDRHINTSRPQVSGLNLRSFRLEWGDVMVDVSGNLAVDRRGFLNGTMTVRIENLTLALETARRLGLWPEEMHPMITRAAGVMASMSDQADTINAPFIVDAGVVRFGPIVLGELPRITLP